MLSNPKHSTHLSHRYNHRPVWHLIQIVIPLRCISFTVLKSISLRSDIKMLGVLLLNHQPFFGPSGQQILSWLEYSDSLGHLASLVVKAFVPWYSRSYAAVPCVKWRFVLFFSLFNRRQIVSLHDLIELLRSSVFGVLTVHYFALMVLEADTGIMLSFKSRDLFIQVVWQPCRYILGDMTVLQWALVVTGLPGG